MKILLTSIVLWSYTTSVVYICDSKTANVYHKTKNCKGIYNCKAEIKGSISKVVE